MNTGRIAPALSVRSALAQCGELSPEPDVVALEHNTLRLCSGAVIMYFVVLVHLYYLTYMYFVVLVHLYYLTYARHLS